VTQRTSGSRQRVATAIAARAEAQAARRRRIRALAGAGVVLVLLIGLAVWLTRPSGQPHAAAPPRTTVSCAWSTLPVEARSKEMRDVGTPPATAPRTGTAIMTITTNLGVITVSIDRSAVPCAAANFAYLGSKHFYDNVACHRIVDTGLSAIQCGDPAGDGFGGPPYRYADENLPTNKRPTYAKGVVAVVNSGPNTNQSQFYLVYADSDPEPGLPVLGRVTGGLDIVEQVAAAGHDNAFATNPDGTAGPGGGHPKKPLTVVSLTVS
jgi:peptidyl-prolyl cis-trans isomerase B (cyclophilin B)